MHDPVDAWHDHTKDQKPQAEHGEIRNPMMVMGVGLGLFLAVVASVVAVEAFYKWYAAQALKAGSVATGPNSPAMETRAERLEVLKKQMGSEPSWVVVPGTKETPAKAIVQLPLKAAAERVLAEYSGKK